VCEKGMDCTRMWARKDREGERNGGTRVIFV